MGPLHRVGVTAAKYPLCRSQHLLSTKPAQRACSSRMISFASLGFLILRYSTSIRGIHQNRVPRSLLFSGCGPSGEIRPAPLRTPRSPPITIRRRVTTHVSLSDNLRDLITGQLDGKSTHCHRTQAVYACVRVAKSWGCSHYGKEPAGMDLAPLASLNSGWQTTRTLYTKGHTRYGPCDHHTDYHILERRRDHRRDAYNGCRPGLQPWVCHPFCFTQNPGNSALSVVDKCHYKYIL